MSRRDCFRVVERYAGLRRFGVEYRTEFRRGRYVDFVWRKRKFFTRDAAEAWMARQQQKQARRMARETWERA